MGKLFGGGGKQTQTQTNAPWEAAQPFLKDIYGEAQKLYQGGTPEFWGGPALAGMSPELQAALQGTTARAVAGSPLAEAGQNAIYTAATGGFAGMNPATDFLTGLLYGGQQNPAADYASALAGQVSGGTNPALQYLTQEASGANVGKNPWLDATYDQALQKSMQAYKESTIPALQSDYALSGRTGSNAYAKALAGAKGTMDEQANQLATQIYGGAYGQDRALQAQAMQGLSGAYSTDIQSKLGAGQFLQGTYDADLQRQLYGAQQLGQIGQQDLSTILSAAQAAPGMAATDYADLDRLMQIGQYTTGRSQSELDLERQRFEHGQNAPLNWLQQYANLVYGNPGSSGYGTTTTTSKQPSNVLGNILSTAASIGSMFMSDERMKTDIERVGTLDNDLPVYKYRFIFGGPPMIGVMAQDVERRDPGAVHSIWGVKHVDYARAVR